MRSHEFTLLQRILKERSGITLSPDKQDLLEGKLRHLLKELELPSISHLAALLMKPEGEPLRSRVAQTAAVQESYFFRDKAPFRYFADVMLPTLMARRWPSRRIRAWCAAASSGQEPYSLAMEIAERQRDLVGWNVEIVATDFSAAALRKARNGVYSQFEVQRGLPVSLLVKHFTKVGNGWEISPAMRSRVQFQEHNLLTEYETLGTFDVIFCRNVLIYFDDRTKREVLARLAAQLTSDGYLVLGAAETTTGSSPDFVPVPGDHHGIFALSPKAAAARVLLEERRSGAERSAGPDGGTTEGRPAQASR